MALAFKIPVILSTVGVEMGVNGPTVESLRAVLPQVQDIESIVDDTARLHGH
jgi:hypothetical protein